MLAEEIMTKNVLAVGQDTSVAAAARLMVDHCVSGLPVMGEDGQVVGVLSEGDLLRRVELHTEAQMPGWLRFLRGPAADAEAFVQTHTLHVKDIMTLNPYIIDAGAPLSDVVEKMIRHHVRRLPVVKDGKLIGIVTRADLVRELSHHLDRAVLESEPAREDATLLKDVRDAIAAQTWSRNCAITINVDKGKVKISGTVFLDGVEDALRVCAGRVEGVRAVETDMEFLVPAPLGV